jgi:hypothetical protein
MFNTKQLTRRLQIKDPQGEVHKLNYLFSYLLILLSLSHIIILFITFTFSNLSSLGVTVPSWTTHTYMNYTKII